MDMKNSQKLVDTHQKVLTLRSGSAMHQRNNFLDQQYELYIMK